MCVNMCCHAVFYVENPISSHGNINLHVMRRGISLHGIVYMMRDLSMEVSYRTDENEY